MAKRMAADRLAYVRVARRLFDRPLQHIFIEMVSAYGAAARIRAELARRKNVLPTPFPGGARILAFQGVRKIDLSVPRSQVAPVQGANFFKMRFERLYQRPRQQGGPVLRALALANPYLPRADNDILHPQPQAFRQAQA